MVELPAYEDPRAPLTLASLSHLGRSNSAPFYRRGNRLPWRAHPGGGTALSEPHYLVSLWWKVIKLPMPVCAGPCSKHFL